MDGRNSVNSDTLCLVRFLIFSTNHSTAHAHTTKDQQLDGAMRLTADVILRAQVSINPLRERELNLRGILYVCLVYYLSC